MDKFAGTLMMIAGVALFVIGIPPASWVALVALVSGGILFVGGIEVIRNPSSREGTD